MSSLATLTVGRIRILETRYWEEPTIMMLFTEDDKKVSMPKKNASEDEYPQVEYKIKLGILKDRLEFMGFTFAKSKKQFNDALRSEIESHIERLKDPSLKDQSWKRFNEEKLEAFRSVTFDKWFKALTKVLISKETRELDWKGPDDFWEPVEIFNFLESENKVDLSIWAPFIDYRAFMRIICEIANLDAEVIFDLSEIVYAEDLDPNDLQLCAWARRQTADDIDIDHKIIILTEGNSDKWIIEKSLNLFYPHLSEYYSFMDYEGARAQGGATALVNAIKSFVAAGIANRTIAIFDNDTAASSAKRLLEGISIPPNIKVLQLPHAKWAVKYPTLGPQGLASMDVNGLAGSIELYFGKDVLIKNRKRMPVMWKGYDEYLKKYQGELLNKSELQKIFSQKIEVCLKDRSKMKNYDWAGMKQVVDLIKHAFSE